jgi:hypothetical protein
MLSLVEHKQCPQEIVSPSYNLRRKSDKFPGWEEKFHRGTWKRESFKAEKSHREPV